MTKINIHILSGCRRHGHSLRDIKRQDGLERHAQRARRHRRLWPPANQLLLRHSGRSLRVRLTLTSRAYRTANFF